MSYTEIYKFKKDGDAELVAETKNAFRGAMAVWNILDEKYLPPFIPSWATLMNDPNKRYYRSADIFGNGIKEVWGLFDDEKVSNIDKVVLGSTFDNVIVMKDDLPKLIDCFRKFEGDTSLKEQADYIEECFKNDDDLIAIAWKQTSVNGDAWMSDELGEDEGGEECYLPYNILKHDKHWGLFQDISQTAE